MIIRQIQPADIPALIHLGGMMHEESNMRCLDYSPQKVADYCYHAIQSPEENFTSVAVEKNAIVGMFSAYTVQPFYSNDCMAWDEICYVAPPFRGSSAFFGMVKAYVRWAKTTAAKMIFLSNTSGINSCRVMKLFNKIGFAPAGGVFCMEV